MDSDNELYALSNQYKLQLSKIINDKDIFDFYNIDGVPVLIALNANGKLINRQEGVSDKWNLKEFLTYFEN